MYSSIEISVIQNQNSKMQVNKKQKVKPSLETTDQVKKLVTQKLSLLTWLYTLTLKMYFFIKDSKSEKNQQI